MVKQLIEIGRGCACLFDTTGGETVYPVGKPSDYLAERAKRRTERHQVRLNRYRRKGRAPGIEIHTV